MFFANHTQKIKQSKNRRLYVSLVLLIFACLVGGYVSSHQSDQRKQAGAESSQEEAVLFTDEITNVLDEFEDGKRIYTEFYDNARIPYVTVYEYPVYDDQVQAAVPPPQNIGGTNYYRVTSTNASEDTGDEVCAIATGTACQGYVDESVTGFSVCSAYNPTAAQVTDVNGDLSVTYCDGAPQTGPCASLSNTCLACPTCTNGVACDEAIGTLYREMYVTCAATSFTADFDLCTAGLDDDDGSGDGILDLTAAETAFDNSSVQINGCTIAIDGAHTFTNLQIINGGVLTQSATGTGAINKTELTVTGDTVIGSGSEVRMLGTGAAGDYTINPSISTTNAVNDTSGRNGHGGVPGTDPDLAYGDYFDPQFPGSGGTKSDGDGGGYFSLVTDDFSHQGTISANGATISLCGGSSGSGGGIKITATGVVSGNGTIQANAGQCTNTGSSGGGGRIAIIYSTTGGQNTTRPEDLFTIEAVNVEANGGAPGTIYIEDTNTHTAQEGRLIIDGGVYTYFSSSGAIGTPLPATVNLDELEMNNARVTMTPTGEATLNIETLIDVQGGSVLTYTDMESLGLIKRLIIDATGATVQVDSTSTIDARGKGAIRNNKIDPATSTTNAVAGNGNAHAGIGLTTNTVDEIYGDFTDPQFPGGGSTGASTAGKGGGYIRILAEDFFNDGLIRADGASISCNSPAPAGGGIKIVTTGNLTGSGEINVNAGDCTNGIATASPGRLAFYYTTAGGINPTAPDDLYTLESQSPETSATDNNLSTAGTIYVEDAEAVNLGTYSTGEGRLIIANPGGRVWNDIGTYIPGTVTLYELEIDQATVTAETLIVENQIRLSNNAILRHEAMESLGVFRRLNINSPNADLSIDASSSINLRTFGVRFDQIVDLAQSTTNAVTGTTPSHGGVPGDDASVAYGDFFDPQYPGSGGSLNSASANGGGYVNLHVETLDLQGTIRADGGSTGGCGGSVGAGGGIKITVDSTYSGAGEINADSGNCTNTGSGASGGRIAFFYTTAGSINATPPDQQYNIHAYGIDGVGGAGTIYIEDAEAINLGTYSANEGRLIIENGTVNTGVVGTPLLGTLSVYELIVDGAKLTANTIEAENTITVQNTGTIRPESMTSLGPIERLTINSPNADLSIDATSNLMAFATGPVGNNKVDPQLSTTNAVSGSNRGHGGIFGTGYSLAYGDFRNPTFPGSAGNFGNAGGAIIVSVNDLNLLGSINANAASGGGCGGFYGTGGSINITTTGELTGSGTVTAIGSRCTNAPTATNGGGRIAFFYDSDPSGAAVNASPETIYSLDVTDDRNAAGPGTVYVEDDNATNGDVDNEGDLIIDGAGFAVASTPIFTDETPTSLIVNNLTVTNSADLILTSPCTGSLTVKGSIDLSGGGSISDDTAGACATSFTPLSITSALPDGNINTAYSEQVDSPGGFAPKTFECLDGLGGSVVACNVASGWPTGITMNATGLVTGTPTTSGTFNPVIRVTDSDPGGAQVVEQTMSLFVNSAPSEPTLVSPADASQVGTTTPTLSAQYIDPDSGDVGTTNYRISSGSAGDCLSNTNIVDSGTSAATATNNEATTYVVGTPLSHASTYNWCAQNNDGAALSNSGNFTTMGSFTVNLGTAPNEPVLVSPGDTDTTNLLSPVLEANYSDADGGDTGTTEFRVSSGSAANCLSNVNVVFSGSSPETLTNDETASVTVGVALTNLTTYNWCARNNDGVFTSNSGNFTTMGSFLVDTSFTPGGSLGTILNNQQNQQGGGGNDQSGDDQVAQETTIDSYTVDLSFENVNKQPLTGPVNPDEVIFGRLVMTNTNTIAATDVFMNLPIPEVMQYIPGSLQINTAEQSDAADGDPGQGNQNAVSAIWAEIDPQETKVIEFQLLFNQQISDGTQAAAIAELQAEVSTGNASTTFFSNLVQLESEDQPVSTPTPTPTPDPEPTPIPDTTDDSSEPVDPVTPGDPIPDSDPVSDVEPDSEPVSDPLPVTEPPNEVDAPSTLGPTSPIIPLTPSEDIGGNQPTGTEQPAGQEGDEDLFLTGSVQSQNNQLEFTGTVNEPNSEVVVIINGQEQIVVSDENGAWQAFVSAEELGVEQGQAEQVRVEAFAQNQGKVSNRIAQDIFVERTGPELQAAPVVEIVSSNTLVRSLSNVTSQLQEAISNQEEEIQTTLTVVAPIVVVSSIPIWGYLPYLPTMIFHFFSWLLGLFGRKKKDERFFGIVYDSVSKQPVPLAIVRIYRLAHNEPGLHERHARQLVKTVVTDKEGRYEALLEAGDYELEVKKPQFTFPSAIVTSGPDGDYTSIYTGITLSGTESILIPDIPIDPINAPKQWQTGHALKKLWMTLQKVSQHLAVPVLFIGAGAALLVLVNDPNSIVNWILTILYILMLVMQITFRLHPPKAWGMVYDIATNAALPLVSLQLIDPEFGKVIKTRLSDYEGRFYFLPEPGKYVIKANKEGYTQPDVVESRKGRSPIQGEVQIEKEGERINGDLPLKQL